MHASSPTDIDQRIWQVVMMIPAGSVATYGDVARQAGLGRAARRVGRSLRGLPEGTAVPWHRVVNAQGRVVVPGGGATQRRRLESEGVVFRSESGLSLRNYRWQPGSNFQKSGGLP
jgi:methylated-DNA-protein-cysteine methyltransferase-like protein